MTGRIFLKLILGLALVLTLALIGVDYNASKVAGDTYMQNLVREQAEKCRLLAITLDENQANGYTALFPSSLSTNPIKVT